MGPRTRARHAEVHAALASGMNLAQIGRELGLDRRTVRRYERAAGRLAGGGRYSVTPVRFWPECRRSGPGWRVSQR